MSGAMTSTTTAIASKPPRRKSKSAAMRRQEARTPKGDPKRQHQHQPEAAYYELLTGRGRPHPRHRDYNPRGFVVNRWSTCQGPRRAVEG
jgi:hypothetical protein